MCGIAGYLGEKVISPEAADRALALLGRRGPDARGVYRHAFAPGRNVLLLHTRLAIIDLDPRSNQPFTRDGLALAFNGEIYNYIEVRRRLATAGRRFDTDSDTEVLLRVLESRGVDGLDACEGMWAFACYEEGAGRLVLSRDRFGEKPLYLFEDATGLYFASEVKALAALAGRSFTPDLTHLRRYLVNGYKALYKTERTFFTEIAELPRATALTLTADGGRECRAYWTPGQEIDESLSYAQAVEAAREALIRSVRLRLRADVPLAFCMSGGIDSNALIAVAKKVLDYDVHGFTIVNTDERYDEQELVDHAVAALGLRHTAIPVNTAGFLGRLRELVRYHDAPVYTITYYAHWLLMESIREHGYRIAISGTAADELFTGYYDHHGMYLAEVAGDPALFEESLANWNRHIKPIVRNPLLQDPLAFVKNPGQREHIYLDAARFSGYLTEPFCEAFAETRYCPGLLRNRMRNELFNEAVPVILHEDDLNAMYYSIENRSPFLDRGLFDVCASIPTRHLIRDGYNKKVLRDAMRGIVPDRILDCRRKVGFNAPVFSFLDVADAKVREELLDQGPVFDLVRKEAVEAFFAKDRLTNSESKFLFNFLCVKIFLEECAR